MSTDTLHVKLKINFPVIMFAVMILHALFMAINTFPNLQQTIGNAHQSTAPAPIKLLDIRNVGSRESKIRNSTYLAKTDSKVKTIDPRKFGHAPSKSNNTVRVQEKHPLSFSDLAVPKTAVAQTEASAPSTPKVQRPGVRPEVTQEKKAINAISLKGNQIREFMRESSVASNAAELSGDPRARSLSNSDILVNLEVPEGVNPDELNEYELMFYGFQRRTAINYVNTFYKNLDKFQRENPHLHFPLTETKQVMTGRMTFDEKGNVKQIKMIRWTNVDRLQNFFEGVLKDMDTLHNPPKPLWSKTGEFSVFFSLVING